MACEWQGGFLGVDSSGLLLRLTVNTEFIYALQEANYVVPEVHHLLRLTVPRPKSRCVGLNSAIAIEQMWNRMPVKQDKEMWLYAAFTVRRVCNLVQQ